MTSLLNCTTHYWDEILAIIAFESSIMCLVSLAQGNMCCVKLDNSGGELGYSSLV